MTITTSGSSPAGSSPLAHAALADAQQEVFWTDQPGAPEPEVPLTAATDADLVIIGGGFTGLWTAILAKEEHPGWDVLLLEGASIAYGGSGRNGGFISASLTHGIAHGEALWPHQMVDLLRIGRENLQAISDFVELEGIDADLSLVGKTAVALTPHGVRQLPVMRDQHLRWGEDVELLDHDAVQADVHSPTFLGGLRVRSGSGLMDPARLSWGLKAAALRRGVRIHEATPVTSITARGRDSVLVHTPCAVVRAHRVALATNGFRPLLRRLRWRMLPIFDHVLVTEPLTESQRSSIGWVEQQGLTDIGNQFHYFRLTPDGRILWGGYDAIYHRGNRTDPILEDRPQSHALLARQFFATFPQLEGLRFTHKWAGIIDSTSRFTPAIGTAMHGSVAYSIGYTGLGTAASRFGALTMLDLLVGRRTERTELQIVRRKPFPFPPEPLRYPLVQFTRSRLAREDVTGRRGLWLSTLDRLGLGFNS